MPAPLVAPAVCFMAGILLADWQTPPGRPPSWFVLSAPLVLLGLWAVARSRRPHALVTHRALVLLTFACLGFARQQQVQHLPPDHVARAAPVSGDALIRLEGRVTGTPVFAAAEKRNPFTPLTPTPRTRFLLAVERVLPESGREIAAQGLVRISVTGRLHELKPGAKVEVTGRLHRPRGARNPGATDWAAISAREGIHAGVFAPGVDYVRVIAPGGSWWQSAHQRLRALARRLLLAPYAEQVDDVDGAEAAPRLLRTMVLGERSAAGRALNEAFQRVGGMHFLAVSGFHVGIIALLAYGFGCFVLRGGRRGGAAVMAVICVSYALLAEANAPILRATVIVVLAAIARLLNRRLATMNWIPAAVLILLFVQPNDLFRAGFQFSFLLVTVLTLAMPPIYGALHRRPRDEQLTVVGWLAASALRWGIMLLATCVVAWLAALPLALFHFQHLAPWGALQAFVLTPLVTAVVATAVLQLALAWIAGGLVGPALHVLTGWLLNAVAALGDLPHAMIETARPPAWLVWVAYGGAVGAYGLWRLCSQLRTPAAAKWMSSVGLLAAACGAWAGWVLDRPSREAALTLCVLDVGNGSANVVVNRRGEAAVIDVGTIGNFDAGAAAERALRSLRVSGLDLIAISHANFDHYSGVPTLASRLSSNGRLLVNGTLAEGVNVDPGLTRLGRALQRTKLEPEALAAGDWLTLGAVEVEVLWPPDEVELAAANDRSLVLRLIAAGRSVLIPGDIEAVGLAGLVEQHRAGAVDLRSDVLIAPHHGSVLPRVTAAFYEAVSPEEVVVSHRERRSRLVALVAERLPEARLWFTAECGAVTVKVGPAGDLAVRASRRRTVRVQKKGRTP